MEKGHYSDGPHQRGFVNVREAFCQVGDQLLTLVQTFDSDLELKYNKFYIGLAKDGQPNNFVIFRPRKNSLNIDVKLKQSAEIDKQIDETGLDALEYDRKWGNYRFRLTKDDIKKQEEFLKGFIKMAFDYRNS